MGSAEVWDEAKQQSLCAFQFVFGCRPQNKTIWALKGSTPSFELSVKVNRAQYIFVEWEVLSRQLRGKAWGFYSGWWNRRVRRVPKFSFCFELQLQSSTLNLYVCVSLFLCTTKWSVGNTPVAQFNSLNSVAWLFIWLAFLAIIEDVLSCPCHISCQLIAFSNLSTVYEVAHSAVLYLQGF